MCGRLRLLFMVLWKRWFMVGAPSLGNFLQMVLEVQQYKVLAFRAWIPQLDTHTGSDHSVKARGLQALSLFVDTANSKTKHMQFEKPCCRLTKCIIAVKSSSFYWNFASKSRVSQHTWSNYITRVSDLSIESGTPEIKLCNVLKGQEVWKSESKLSVYLKRLNS